MSNERFEALVNAALDGALTPAERDEFDALLAAQPEARAQYDRLRSVHDLLESLPAEPVPPGLHERVVGAIRLQRPRGAARGGSGALRYALVAVLGAAAGAAGVALGPLMATTDTRDLAGTLAPRGSEPALRIAHERVQSEVRLAPYDEFMQLDVRIDSDVTIETRIDLSGTGLSFAGVVPARGRGGELQARANRIRLRSQGRQRYTLILAREQAGEPAARNPVRLEYVHDGVSIEHRTLEAD